MAAQLGRLLGLPYVELDSLYHGPNWTPRNEFQAEVEAFTSQPRWVCEWQYRQVRRLLLDRAETLVWLDYRRPLVMYRVIRRTILRSHTGEELWNGNREPGLLHAFTNKEGIIRWSWDTYTRNREMLLELANKQGAPRIVRLGNPAAARHWLERVVDSG